MPLPGSLVFFCFPALYYVSHHHIVSLGDYLAILEYHVRRLAKNLRQASGFELNAQRSGTSYAVLVVELSHAKSRSLGYMKSSRANTRRV